MPYSEIIRPGQEFMCYILRRTSDNWLTERWFIKNNKWKSNYATPEQAKELEMFVLEKKRHYREGVSSYNSANAWQPRLRDGGITVVSFSLRLDKTEHWYK